MNAVQIQLYKKTFFQEGREKYLSYEVCATRQARWTLLNPSAGPRKVFDDLRLHDVMQAWGKDQ